MFHIVLPFMWCLVSYNYEWSHNARLILFNLGEKSKYEQPAGRGHAFERLNLSSHEPD